MVITDIRFALRTLARNRTFALTAIATLALGISVNTAIFSIIDSVLLTPLPFNAPDRIVTIDGENQGRAMRGTSVAYPDVLEWRASARSFQDIAVMRRQTFNVVAGDRAERANGQRVSVNFFRVFGVQPQLGRSFVADEEVPGREGSVILSDGYWRRQFGASPTIVGQQVLTNGTQYTVVGVMPSGFAYPPEAEMWAPLAPDTSLMQRGSRYIRAVGRLNAGATVEQGAVELNSVSARLERDHPESNTGWRATITPIESAIVGRTPTVLYAFLGAVGFVLLIACANVTNLLLARASGRAREVAVRRALGASGWRLTRQLLTESVVLALGGATVGVLLALWEVRLLTMLVSVPLPPWVSIHVSARGLAFTVAVAVATGMLAGIVPAIRLSSATVGESLATGVRGSRSARRAGTQRTLVIAEVALAVVLLAGAGMLLTSLSRLEAVSPGFKPDSTVIARLTLTGPRYESRVAVRQFYDNLLGRLRGTPGIEAAGAAGALPLSGSTNTSNFRLPGRPQPENGSEPTAQWERVTPEYFRALGIPVESGRDFGPQDAAEGPPVIIVNQTFARTYFPGERDVVGRLIQSGGSDKQATIVGVVGDVHHGGLDVPVQPAMFLPYSQAPDGNMTVVVRSGEDAATVTRVIRDAVRDADPTIPVYDISTMQAQVSRSIRAQRLSATLISVFAAMALVLAAVGVYGLIAYSVAERRHEIGIRLALGARTRDVRRLVVTQGLRLTATGIVVGLIGALVLGRGIRGLLYGMSAVHVPTLIAVGVLLMGIAAVASWLPARRAARTDLLDALRGE